MPDTTEAPAFHELIVDALTRAHPLHDGWRWTLDHGEGLDAYAVAPNRDIPSEERRRVCEVCDQGLSELAGMLPRETYIAAQAPAIMDAVHVLLRDLPDRTAKYTARAIEMLLFGQIGPAIHALGRLAEQGVRFSDRDVVSDVLERESERLRDRAVSAAVSAMANAKPGRE